MVSNIGTSTNWPSPVRCLCIRAESVEKAKVSPTVLSAMMVGG
jgi:hypothetical protein